MRVELQGQGTYTYNCNAPYCYYCQCMGVTKQLTVELPAPKHPKKRKNTPAYQWYNKEELKIIRNNMDIPSKELQKLIPHRSISSIDCTRRKLKKKIEKQEIDQFKESAWLNYLNNKTA